MSGKKEITADSTYSVSLLGRPHNRCDPPVVFPSPAGSGSGLAVPYKEEGFVFNFESLNFNSAGYWESMYVVFAKYTALQGLAPNLGVHADQFLKSQLN